MPMSNQVELAITYPIPPDMDGNVNAMLQELQRRFHRLEPAFRAQQVMELAVRRRNARQVREVVEDYRRAKQGLALFPWLYRYLKDRHQFQIAPFYQPVNGRQKVAGVDMEVQTRGHFRLNRGVFHDFGDCFFQHLPAERQQMQETIYRAGGRVLIIPR
jgi:hypothetical protein